MGHFYTTTGEAAYWQPKKDGSGNRPTNIADARKQNLLPSVTEVLKILDKPALNEWKVRTAVTAVMTAPDIPGEGIDRKIERVLGEERQQDQEAQQARDRGTEIHDVMEKLLSDSDIGKIEDARKILNLDPINPWIMKAYLYLRHKFTRVVATERILIGAGYGGRTDAILEVSPNEHMIVDFKTAKTLPTKSSWPDHVIQLASYAAAYSKDNPTILVSTANLYISTVEPGKFAWFDNPGWNPAYTCFLNILNVWCYMNNYRPL